MGLIEIENLSASYKKNKPIFADVNLRATSGECVALLGANGAGKSTLLKIIAGLHTQYSGELRVAGISPKKYDVRAYAEKLAFVSSKNLVTGYLRVYDVVKLGRFPYRHSFKALQTKDLQAIQKALQTANVEHLKDKFIGEISDGERRKVMIARALSQDSEIILLDEPTVFLDLSSKFSILSMLKKLAAEYRKTIIFSSHDLNIILPYADKIWIIKDKKIQFGTPKECIEKGYFSNFFDSDSVIFDKNRNRFIATELAQKNIS
ncbi:MAG: iron ABC transporter ATP-binding protein [Bacteroidia bacterium]|nr:MAG: iron ABC transporter ATP-binding protein [Bacteroidia bacterium]